MNPDAPLSPQEALEIRITALLMGQLPPEEAAELLRQIAGDPELTKLYSRMSHAVELLREARSIPEQASPVIPLQLSKERREKLFATFRGIKALPSPAPPEPASEPKATPSPKTLLAPPKKKRDWKWVIPMGLAASVVILAGGAVFFIGTTVRYTTVMEPPDFVAEEVEQDKSSSGRYTVAYDRATPEPAPEPKILSSPATPVASYFRSESGKDSELSAAANSLARSAAPSAGQPAGSSGNTALAKGWASQPNNRDFDRGLSKHTDGGYISQPGAARTYAGTTLSLSTATADGGKMADAAPASRPSPLYLPQATAEGRAEYAFKAPQRPTVTWSEQSETGPATAAAPTPSDPATTSTHWQFNQSEINRGTAVANPPVAAGAFAVTGPAEAKPEPVPESVQLFALASTDTMERSKRLADTTTPPAPVDAEQNALSDPLSMAGKVSINKPLAAFRYATDKPAAPAGGPQEPMQSLGFEINAPVPPPPPAATPALPQGIATAEPKDSEARGIVTRRASLDVAGRGGESDGKESLAKVVERDLASVSQRGRAAIKAKPAEAKAESLFDDAVQPPHTEDKLAELSEQQQPLPEVRRKVASDEKGIDKEMEATRSQAMWKVQNEGQRPLNRVDANKAEKAPAAKPDAGGFTVGNGVVASAGEEVQLKNAQKAALDFDSDGIALGDIAQPSSGPAPTGDHIDKLDTAHRRMVANPTPGTTAPYRATIAPKDAKVSGELAGLATGGGITFARSGAEDGRVQSLEKGAAAGVFWDTPATEGAKPQPEADKQWFGRTAGGVGGAVAGEKGFKVTEARGRTAANGTLATGGDRSGALAISANSIDGAILNTDGAAFLPNETNAFGGIAKAGTGTLTINGGSLVRVDGDDFVDISGKPDRTTRFGTIVGKNGRKLAENETAPVDEYFIDPQTVEFEGFINTGKPVRGGRTDAQRGQVLAEDKPAQVDAFDFSLPTPGKPSVATNFSRQINITGLSDDLSAIKLPALGEVESKLAKVEEKVAEQLVEAKPETPKVVEELKKKNESAEPPAPQQKAEPPVPQPEVSTKENAFSTFSLNVSDVSFKLAAASLEKGAMPDLASVRTEEFINALDYRDPEPAPGAALAFTSERARYPFAHNRDLLRLSVKTAAAGRQAGRPLNLVLLLDNSGSMERADRVRILKESLTVLAKQLQPQDKLSIITFARTPRLWADGVTGDKAAEFTNRVSEITPQGGTDLAAAMDLGYTTALKHYQVGSVNRVVLLTDGAANLGDVSAAALKQKVEAHRKQGVAFDCFGVGWEGYNDDLLEQLSRNGDGRYGFINTPEAASTEFAGQLAGALRVAASDVKVQVEFNPRRVTSYRQVGYAKHQLKKEQFRDNTVDAAELGAAEAGNALYIVEVDPRGYGDLATVHVRYKVPGTTDYREQEWPVPFQTPAQPLEQSSSSLRLAGSAAAFAEWLAQSPYAAEVTTDRLLGMLNGVPPIYGADPRPAKLEWMIRQAKSISGK